MRVPAPRGCFRGGGLGARRAALHFCGRPANGSCSRPRRSCGEGGSASARRAYSPASRRSGKRLRRVLRESFALAAQAAPLPRGGGWAAAVRRSGRAGHCLQCLRDGVSGVGRGVGRTLRCGRWRPNGRIRPVLKHGPRSATCARVPGWQTRRRNESEGGALVPAVARAPSLSGGGGASSTDPCVTLWRDLSESVPVATRKMVNYA